MMTWTQTGWPRQHVYPEAKMGHLPGPAVQPMKEELGEPQKSDLQTMMDNEQRDHMQPYIYAQGHNDHGLGG